MKPITLMEDTGESINVIGSAFDACGKLGIESGIHTIQISVNNFSGKIKIQGSVDPAQNIWFDISTPWGDVIEFPQRENYPTNTIGFTFRGNILFVRAVMERDYLTKSEGSIITQYGKVSNILMLI